MNRHVLKVVKAKSVSAKKRASTKEHADDMFLQDLSEGEDDDGDNFELRAA